METLQIIFENKDLVIAGVVIVVVMIFLKFLKGENKISRETQKEISENSNKTIIEVTDKSNIVIREITSAIGNLTLSNSDYHSKIENGQNNILERVKDTHQKVEEIHYQVNNKD